MPDTFDEETALALAAKLDGFDLSADERAILRAIFTLTAGDDVEGFARPTPGGPVPIPYPNVALSDGARPSPLSTSFLAAFRSHNRFLDGT